MSSGKQIAPRPAPLTPEEAQARRDQMHELNDAIKGAMARGRATIWELAAYLDVWDDQVGWSALGYEKLNDWLADPDVSMSRGRFQDLVGTYRELKAREIDADVIQTLEHSKVRIALPAVKRGEADIETVIVDSQELGAQDLREKYRDQAAPPQKPAPEPSPEDSRQIDTPPINGANTSGPVLELPLNGEAVWPEAVVITHEDGGHLRYIPQPESADGAS